MGMETRQRENTHHLEVCPPGSQATLKINKAFEAGSSESRVDTCLGLL